MDHSPAQPCYLPLPLILSSSSGLNPLSLSVTPPLSSSLFPLSHEHNHMCTYYTASRGGCPQSRDRGASVGPSPAINRLLEFIIVSSYDGEEPGGLGERERVAHQAASLSLLALTSLLVSTQVSVSPFLILLL